MPLEKKNTKSTYKFLHKNCYRLILLSCVKHLGTVNYLCEINPEKELFYPELTYFLLTIFQHLEYCKISVFPYENLDNNVKNMKYWCFQM